MQVSILPSARPSLHLFTVDVEDYFQVVAFERVTERSRWDAYPSRVERNTAILLDLLARHDVRGTFFTLGWVAARFPGLVRRISEAGHEIASHGQWHRRVFTLSREEFRQELRQSKAVLEDAAGVACLGYRAPSFSIRPGMEWAFELLLEEGYRYDSSLFPIRRPDYGFPEAPRDPFVIRCQAGTLLELPLATVGWGGIRLPAAGGGYLRHFPYWFTRWAFRQASRRGASATFYIHPWEVDPGQPRLPCGRLTAIRHYRNLERSLPRLERLLRDVRFTTVADRFGGLLADPAADRGVVV
jgi:polysaccharide deacetylase family protein (PEP-CTERM system associated)